MIAATTAICANSSGAANSAKTSSTGSRCFPSTCRPCANARRTSTPSSNASSPSLTPTPARTFRASPPMPSAWSSTTAGRGTSANSKTPSNTPLSPATARTSAPSISPSKCAGSNQTAALRRPRPGQSFALPDPIPAPRDANGGTRESSCRTRRPGWNKAEARRLESPDLHLAAKKTRRASIGLRKACAGECGARSAS